MDGCDQQTPNFTEECKNKAERFFASLEICGLLICNTGDLNHNGVFL
jgi:hypothetical protein